MRFKAIALHPTHHVAHPLEEASRLLKSGTVRVKNRVSRLFGFFSVSCKREMRNALDFAGRKLHRN